APAVSSRWRSRTSTTGSSVIARSGRRASTVSATISGSCRRGRHRPPKPKTQKRRKKEARAKKKLSPTTRPVRVSGQAITPCLWLDHRIEEAVDFYISVFGDGAVLSKSYYGEGAPQPKGSVLAMTFSLRGQTFMAINGGPIFKFTEAVSFMVKCESQA